MTLPAIAFRCSLLGEISAVLIVGVFGWSIAAAFPAADEAAFNHRERVDLIERIKLMAEIEKRQLQSEDR